MFEIRMGDQVEDGLAGDLQEETQKLIMRTEEPHTNASSEDVRLLQDPFDALSPHHYYTYGLGHFMNDLGGAIYFNYLLYFLKRVVLTPSAPLAFLVGQIVDGIATPLVGYFSDRTPSGRFGKRKPWYVSGFVIFLVGYFGIYQNIVTLKPGISNEAETGYYVTFMSLVNIGWAAVQISHMSLVPSLTSSTKRRDKLNNIRNSFTFLANMVVLGFGTILFATVKNSTLAINLLSYIAAGLGIPAAIVFVATINEKQLTEASEEKIQSLIMQYPEEEQILKLQQKKTNKETIDWKYWFSLPKFYIFGLCYMSVRLYCNLFGTLLPFYLVDVLQMGTKSEILNNEIPFQVALVALVITIVQYVNSHLVSSFYYKRIGRKNTLMLGTLFSILSSLIMVFLTPSTNWVMFLVAILVGISQTLVLSTGINLISDVVGADGSKGAFVFGIYSFLDKISSGLAIFFIISGSEFDSSVTYKKWMSIVMPMIMCVVSSGVVYFTPVKEYTKRGEMVSEGVLDQLAL